MADPKRRYPGNAPGAFFVDSTCIDCDTCRQLAPAVFTAEAGHSIVHAQPGDPAALAAAARAALCCPTHSIGAVTAAGKAAIRAGIAELPQPVAGAVHYCGFNAEASFGAHSYLLRHPAGNWLVDAPRWEPHLVAAFAARGGLAGIFLTHADDVGDADRYAARFGARRVIHARDRAACPDAETLLGDDPAELAEGLVAIPVPGHTAGSTALHWREGMLFTGDHLWWDRGRARLSASRTHCWHSWTEQQASMRRLLDWSFSWVLPGHGDRISLPPPAMHEELEKLLVRMQESPDPDS